MARQMALLSSASFPVPQCNDVIARVFPPQPYKHWECEQFELAMNALVPKTLALKHSSFVQPKHPHVQLLDLFLTGNLWKWIL